MIVFVSNKIKKNPFKHPSFLRLNFDNLDDNKKRFISNLEDLQQLGIYKIIRTNKGINVQHIFSYFYNKKLC